MCSGQSSSVYTSSDEKRPLLLHNTVICNIIMILYIIATLGFIALPIICSRQRLIREQSSKTILIFRCSSGDPRSMKDIKTPKAHKIHIIAAAGEVSRSHKQLTPRLCRQLPSSTHTVAWTSMRWQYPMLSCLHTSQRTILLSILHPGNVQRAP